MLISGPRLLTACNHLEACMRSSSPTRRCSPRTFPRDQASTAQLIEKARPCMSRRSRARPGGAPAWRPPRIVLLSEQLHDEVGRCLQQAAPNTPGSSTSPRATPREIAAADVTFGRVLGRGAGAGEAACSGSNGRPPAVERCVAATPDARASSAADQTCSAPWGPQHGRACAGDDADVESPTWNYFLKEQQQGRWDAGQRAAPGGPGGQDRAGSGPGRLSAPKFARRAPTLSACASPRTPPPAAAPDL